MDELTLQDKITHFPNLESFEKRVNDSLFPMQIHSPDEQHQQFTAGMANQQLGGIDLAVITSSPVDVYRRSSDIGQQANPYYQVKIQVEGEAQIFHRGHEIVLSPGDFTLCLSSEPYELHFPNHSCQVVLTIPESIVNELAIVPMQHLGVRMDSTVGVNGLFSQFVTAIANQITGLDGSLGERLEANVLDLLATTLNHAREARRRDLLQTGVKQEYLQRIRYFIRKNLEDDRLSPDWIASAHHISTRYLHMLFEAEEVTISRYILTARLERCHAALMDKSFNNYPVSEIAYRFGFKDASHFSRVFRTEYGTTPANLRKQVLAGC